MFEKTYLHYHKAVLTPVTVVLKLRETGAESPCKWCSRVGIYSGLPEWARLPSLQAAASFATLLSFFRTFYYKFPNLRYYRKF